MQKVYQNCYEMDKKCYEMYGLSEDILMEHAAGGMAQYIRCRFAQGASVLIVAGAGNNGADGIALARLLYGDYHVMLYLPFELKSKMSLLQRERAERVGIRSVDEPKDADVIVDALFGAGLNRKLDEKAEHIIHKLNSFKGYKIACDIPSGIAEDGRLMPCAFEADVTLTMGAHKESLYLDEGKDSIGKIEKIDLGVSHLIYEDQSRTFVLESSDLRVPSRKILSAHKGNFGHAVLFCGEKEGAGVIAAMAAARYGSGLTTLVIHEPIVHPPYLMAASMVPSNASAIGIGMGLGSYFEDEFLTRYVIKSHLPVVLDADAMYVPKLLGILEQKDRQIVVTPHPKEFVSLWKILTGEQLSVAEVQAKRFEIVRRFNARYPHVTLLLKGANTLIAQEEQLYINPLGCSKLSKGGSGDVLSGLIVSLLAQGYTALDAAIQGSLALVLAAGKYTGASYAMVSTDLIDEIGKLEQY